ncbi:class I SAM-dependent methyltransferase [Tessaracoccus massiliensis]|uniref:class I SAM-dependent methyltransferase n=1 Tax=Tessaracoccus massiliensis TaxID=1522311 RepID=UPI000693D1D2|nr:class I SAM-dependent methyltransferase [Tessaracoccus massiliensis]
MSITLPDEALTWLSVWQDVRALALAEDAHLTRRLSAAGNTIFALTDNPKLYTRLSSLERVTALLARPEAIPTDPLQFEVVFAHQSLHRYDLAEALPQLARVLRPGGCVSASYLVRDDSVPWVRRLAALLRRYDPMAMKGDYGHQSLDVLGGSKYFPEVERRAFRIWQPISRDNLVAMVRNQPLASNLDQSQLDGLINQVTDLFDGAVRPGENLRLPYQLLCWRAWVSHEELTGPVHLPDSGLAIPL